MYAWVWLTCLYGFIKAVREVIKKKTLEQSSIAEVLFFYSFLGFIFTLPTCDRTVFDVTAPQLGIILIKSFAVFVAWILSFIALKNVPVSFCGVMDMSRIIFSTLLAITVLGEKMTLPNIIGFFVVLAGILLLNLKKGTKGESTNIKFAFILLVSCFFNACSGTIDRIIMQDMSSSQVQFWYMLFISVLYLIFMLCSQKGRVNWKGLKTNWWIPILSLIFIIGDKAIFIANAYPECRVSVMTLIKQSSVFVVVLLGKLLYKDKNIWYKLFCATVVLAGIAISLL